MKPKTLTLLILTAIVMASVACGPSAKEQKELIQEQKTIMLCEDALERRIPSIDKLEKLTRTSRVVTSKNERAIYRDLAAIEEKHLASIEKDINRYCK